MKSSKVIPIAVATVLLSLLPSTTHAQLAVSTFDTGTGADGWVIADRSETDLQFIGTRPVIHISPGGNPGGFLQASDSTPNWWYWRAPAKFLGDKSIAYGGSLSFDLISDLQTGHEGLSVYVILEGGGVSLITSFDFLHEANIWRHFSVALLESAGWKNFTTQNRATAQEMRLVLANLKVMDINGEYASGLDTGGLDNVVLRAGCPLPNFVRASEVEVCWPSVSNSAYHVEYRTNLTASIWVPLVTNLVATGVETCFTDKIARGTPQRFYSAPPLGSIRVSEVETCWPTEPNSIYQVEYKSASTTNIWVPLYTNILGTGAQMCLTNQIVHGAPERSYRLSCLTP